MSNSLTLADLEAMPDDGRRYELIDGAFCITASPSPAHQRVSRRLLALLEAATPPGHEVLDAPIDLDLHGAQRVQPDMVIVPSSSVGPKRLTLPALLVVEIVSGGSTTHDTVTNGPSTPPPASPPTGSSTPTATSPPSASTTPAPTSPTPKAEPSLSTAPSK